MLSDLDMLAQKLEADRSVKVVVFQSAHPEVFVAHADTNFLKDMSGTAVSRGETKLLDLQRVLERISKLPQATIAKIEGFARGGGHEFALACDMRFAARGKAKFMQMEVAMGILPCGGGASRMARQVGLGRALEIVLSARDWDADEAERVGTVNRALDPEDIGPFVEELAKRIALWPAASINATKQAVYESIDKPIDDALRAEAYWLYQAVLTECDIHWGPRSTRNRTAPYRCARPRRSEPSPTGSSLLGPRPNSMCRSATRSRPSWARPLATTCCGSWPPRLRLPPDTVALKRVAIIGIR